MVQLFTKLAIVMLRRCYECYVTLRITIYQEGMIVFGGRRYTNIFPMILNISIFSNADAPEFLSKKLFY